MLRQTARNKTSKEENNDWNCDSATISASFAKGTYMRTFIRSHAQQKHKSISCTFSAFTNMRSSHGKYLPGSSYGKLKIVSYYAC